MIPDENKRVLLYPIEYADGWDAFVIRWYPLNACVRYLARRLLATQFKDIQDFENVIVMFKFSRGSFRILNRKGAVKPWAALAVPSM